MQIKIDKASDTLYFRLDENTITESEEIQPGVVLDYDERNQVVGVEFQHISTRVNLMQLQNLQFQNT